MLAAAVLALSACGSESRVQSRPAPRLPRAVATKLAVRSDALASRAPTGDGCAREDPDARPRAPDPARDLVGPDTRPPFRARLLAAVDDLAGRMPSCVPHRRRLRLSSGSRRPSPARTRRRSTTSTTRARRSTVRGTRIERRRRSTEVATGSTSVIGRGGMALVYRGRRPRARTSRSRSRCSPTTSPPTRSCGERFAREAALAGRLSHPNVVRVLGERGGRRAGVHRPRVRRRARPGRGAVAARGGSTPRASPSSAPRPRRRSRTRTSAGSSTATSSRRTCCSRVTGR